MNVKRIIIITILLWLAIMLSAVSIRAQQIIAAKAELASNNTYLVQWLTVVKDNKSYRVMYSKDGNSNNYITALMGYYNVTDNSSDTSLQQKTVNIPVSLAGGWIKICSIKDENNYALIKLERNYHDKTPLITVKNNILTLQNNGASINEISIYDNTGSYVDPFIISADYFSTSIKLHNSKGFYFIVKYNDELYHWRKL